MQYYPSEALSVELEWAMMMGRTVVAMVKKFWILAVVFTLALSLTSCSGGNYNNYSGGYASLQCSGPKDSFLVELDPLSNSTYDLVLTPTSLSTEGVVAEIALVGDTVNQLDVVNTSVTLYTGLPTHISLTLDDVENYSNVAVAHTSLYNPSASFVQLPAGAVCQIPTPGDGNQAGN